MAGKKGNVRPVRIVMAIMLKVKPGVYKRLYVGDNIPGMNKVTVPEAIAVHGNKNIMVLTYEGC